MLAKVFYFLGRRLISRDHALPIYLHFFEGRRVRDIYLPLKMSKNRNQELFLIGLNTLRLIQFCYYRLDNRF